MTNINYNFTIGTTYMWIMGPDYGGVDFGNTTLYALLNGDQTGDTVNYQTNQLGTVVVYPLPGWPVGCFYGTFVASQTTYGFEQNSSGAYLQIMAKGWPLPITFPAGSTSKTN